MLSRASYAYCEAKRICEDSWRGQIYPGGDYSFMGRLGTELGITDQILVAFWLHSSGCSIFRAKILCLVGFFNFFYFAE